VRLLRLRFVNGPRRGEELIFSAPRVRIGRSRDNALVLSDSDTPLSSGHHAEAIVEGGAWWIVDAGSTNGTFVNGSLVTRHRLAKGDTLVFGDAQVVVVGVGRAGWIAPAAATILVAAAIAAAATFAIRHRAPMPYEEVAARAARSVYAVVIDDGGRRTVVGTAFAIAADGQLATNAHVADLLRQRGVIAADSVGRALAIRGDTFDGRRIADVTMHPQWQPGSIRNDVAVLRLEQGDPLTPLAVVDEGAFARLQRGTALASFGFPAVATDPVRPRGRLSVDVVGDVRGDYLEADLSIAPGTSGSPVFNEAGSVVAIVAGGDFVTGERGIVVPSGSRVNWAISATCLRDILQRR
jgi:S1-C subfamily serine protease